MNIQDFLSRLDKDGIAKTNLFKVIFGVPSGEGNPFNADDMRALSYWCENAEFPGRTFKTNDSRIYGPSFKTPFLSEYPELTFTLICDEKLNQKDILDKWMNFTNPPNGFDFNYRDSYIADVTIQQLSLDGSVSYQCRLREAFPVSVNALVSNWNDDNIHRVQATFTYRYWEFMPVKEEQTQSSSVSV